MKIVIKLIGILFILSGISYFFIPERVFAWIEDSSENTTFYVFAIGMRFVLGILFIMLPGNQNIQV